MVGYVLDDMLMEVFIEPKPQLHTSRFGLCAIARGKLVGCAAAGDGGAAVEGELVELVEDGMDSYS